MQAHQLAIELESLVGGTRCVGADRRQGLRQQAGLPRRLEVGPDEPRRRDALGLREPRAGSRRADEAGDRGDRERAHARQDLHATAVAACARGVRGRGDGERVAVVRERARGTPEALLFQRSEPHQELEARSRVAAGCAPAGGGAGHRELGVEHLRERGPVAPRLLDPRERAQRADLAWQHIERLLIGRGRAVEIAELLLLQRRDLDEQRGALVSVLLARGALAIRREQLVPVREQDRELLQVLLRVPIVGHELEDLAVIAARALGIIEPAHGDPRELADDGQPLRHAERAARAELRLELRGDLAPLGRLLREPQHVGEQLRARRIELERAQRPRERQGPRCQLVLAQRANPRDHGKLARRIGRRRELDLVHGEQARPLLLLRVDRGQRDRGAEIRGVHRQHALPHLPGALERELRGGGHGRRAGLTRGSPPPPLGGRPRRGRRGRRGRRRHGCGERHHIDRGRGRRRVGPLLRELRRALDERQPRRLPLEAIRDHEQRIDQLLALPQPCV